MPNAQPKMTSTEARSFDRFSVANAATVMQARGCGCEPYVDVFTYNRWKAQGMQVQRGEKSIKIPTIRRIERENADGERESFGLRRMSSVFCRCQVASK